MRVRTQWLLVPMALVAMGCPSKVEHKYGVATKKPPKEATEDDPRVAKKGEDLYPAESVERAEAKQRPQAPTAGRGSGKPDESNGKCRLYAPKLPQPECCVPEFGFDEQTVRTACNLDVYMGESWQHSCGYYFHNADGRDVWFRASFISETTAQEAADGQARQLKDKLKADVEVTKVPGTQDAYWMTHDNLGWAYIGGWPAVRQFAWRSDSCTPRGLSQVIAKMELAKPPAKGAARLALVPKARG